MTNVTIIDTNGLKINLNINEDPNEFFRKIYELGSKWDVNYDQIDSKIKKHWLGADLYWRFRRSIESKKPIIFGEKIYRAKNPMILEEVNNVINKITSDMRKVKGNKFWLNEENDECSTIITI